jgi:YD repeat-containing protein
MTDDLRSVCREIAQLKRGRPGTTVRYPVSLRRRITALAQECRARGRGGFSALARDLGLPRWTAQVTYADASTTTYTWDAGHRLTQLTDSQSGTIARTYDRLDRLTQETTPQGTVSYTYDAAGRRTSLTVAGQAPVTYTYDDANRLQTITQGSHVVTFTYDAAGRRTTLTLPNGVVTEYGYDAASQLTSLTYRHGSTTLGTLTCQRSSNTPHLWSSNIPHPLARGG